MIAASHDPVEIDLSTVIVRIAVPPLNYWKQHDESSKKSLTLARITDIYSDGIWTQPPAPAEMEELVCSILIQYPTSRRGTSYADTVTHCTYQRQRSD